MQERISKIYLATDHAGFDLKEKVKLFLEKIKIENDFESYNLSSNFQIVDHGANAFVADDDYTEYMHKAALSLSEDEENLSNKSNTESNKSIAFVFGGSGAGEGIVMNRYKKNRCITYYGKDLSIIKLGREHNDANSISFGARFVNYEECIESISVFMNTMFLGGKHSKRVLNIDKNKDHNFSFLSRFFS